MGDSNWQTELSTLKERVEYAFNKSLFCDVEFSVVDSNGDKVTVPANKYLLAISSSVFEAMFYGQLAESKSTIELPDCTKDGLYELLRYVNTDEVHLTGSNCMEVLYLAKKYMMPFLVEKCYDFLAEDLSPEDAFSVLSQAQKSYHTKAEELCWNVVDFETYKAVTSDAFLSISHELLKQVLERETLHTNEVNLFKAVNRWASNQIQDESRKSDGKAKRELVGDDLIRLIRFPVMSQKEFAENVLVSEILHRNEVTEIVQVFSSVAPSQTSFEGTKRKGQWSERWSENRFTAVEVEPLRTPNTHGRKVKSKTSSIIPETELKTHSIVLQVNKPIFLAGVRVFGEAYSATSTISFNILKSFKRYLFQTSFSSGSKKPQRIDNSYSAYTILMDRPILLEPNDKYVIEVSMKSPYKGSGGEGVIKCDDIEITLSNTKNSATTVECGQFPSFLLKRKIAFLTSLKRLVPRVPEEVVGDTAEEDTSEEDEKQPSVRTFSDTPAASAAFSFGGSTPSPFAFKLN